MPEEIKQEVKTMDEAFKDVIEPSKDVVATEETQGTTAAVTDETTQVATEETTQGKVVEKSWKDFGLDNLEGKSTEQIAQEISYRNKLYGDQSNEIGTMKRKLQEAETKVADFEKLAGREPEKKIVDQMTEGQLADFYRDMESDPRKAISNLIKGSLTDEIKAAVLESVKEQGTPGSDEKLSEAVNSIEWRNFTERNPDWQDYYGMMNVLTGEEHFGGNRPFDEVYQLAKLSKTNEPLYRATYQFMATHDKMSFAEAMDYAQMKMTAPAKAMEKKDGIKKEIADIKGGAGGSTQTKEAEWQLPEGQDGMDAAFE